MPEIVSKVVDVFVYRVPNDRPEFLLLRRSPGRRLEYTWQAVHGHIEDGETAVQAAAREMYEETQLEVLAWHQLEVLNAFYVTRSDEVHLCPMFAARVADNAQPVLNYEHDEFVWADFDDAMGRFHWAAQKRAITEVRYVIIPGGPTAESLRIATA